MAVAVAMVGGGAALLSAILIELSVPVVLYLALARVFAGNPHLQVAVTRREGGGKVTEGGNIEVEVTATNKGSWVPLLLVNDWVPPGLKVTRGSEGGYASLQRGESVVLRYVVVADAPGSWELGPLTARAEDGFGLTSRSATLDVPFVLDSLPRVDARIHFPFRPLRTKNWPGQVVSPRAGTGLDFYGLRQYVPSDPARAVNWKASARLGKLYSNQYMGELGAESVLVVDKSSESDFGTSPASALDYVERCAAGVARGLVLSGNSLGLLVFGERTREISPRTGRRQLERILLELVRAEKGPVATYPYLPTYLSHFFPRSAQVIVVSSLMDPDFVEPLLVLGARRDVRIISPALPVPRPGPALTDSEEAATKLLRLQRWTTLERLRKRTMVAEWDVTGPIESALGRVLYERRLAVVR